MNVLNSEKLVLDFFYDLLGSLVGGLADVVQGLGGFIIKGAERRGCVRGEGCALKGGAAERSRSDGGGDERDGGEGSGGQGGASGEPGGAESRGMFYIKAVSKD